MNVSAANQIAGVRYQAREAAGPDDLADAQRLRHLCFIEHAGLADRAGRLDRDKFDPHCRHILIEAAQTGTLVACFRLLSVPDGRAVASTYAAQSYDLKRLATFPGKMAEVGRFCVHPNHQDADILRVAWGALTRIVDETGVDLLFGCSSFSGTDPVPYGDAFALLANGHLAPSDWRPLPHAASVYPFAALHRGQVPNRHRALAGLPPLLRTYLVMGGWVSDHAVIDHDLNTLHVFTGLEIGKVPAARARALRAVAG